MAPSPDRLVLVDPQEFATAVDDLAALSPAARRLLSECIETQGITRAKLSKSAIALEDAGFIRVREARSFDTTSFQLLPSLAGEEAMDGLRAKNGDV